MLYGTEIDLPRSRSNRQPCCCAGRGRPAGGSAARPAERSAGWGRLLAAALAVALVAAGCTSGDSLSERNRATTTSARDADGTGAPRPNPGVTLADPPAAVLQAVAALPGRLAIGKGPALTVAAPDGTDAVAVDQTAGATVSQPTWSHSGTHLVWSRTTDTAVEVVDRDLATGQDAVTDLAPTPGFYFQWSADDQTVAYLRTDPFQGGVELGLIDPGSPAVRVGAASPVFLSWAPTAPVLAAHVAAEQVLVLPSRFALPGATTLQDSSVLTPTGAFSAPAWVDDATVLAVSPDGLVAIDAATGAATVVAEVGTGALRFVLSPDRKRVAVAEAGSAGAVSPAGLRERGSGPVPIPLAPASPVQGGAGDGGGGASGLRIVELATGAVTAVTPAAPLAFEWAPDSVRLAWLEAGVSAALPRNRWNFWDGRVSTPSVSYQVSDTMQNAYLPFFEQYAQSVTGWSPDSSAFAFAGHPDGGPDGDGVWVQLIGVPGAPPVRVADGDVVAWSPAG